MGKVKLFPTAEYTSKQPRDPIVPRVPCTGIFLGPSKSGSTLQNSISATAMLRCPCC